MNYRSSCNLCVKEASKRTEEQKHGLDIPRRLNALDLFSGIGGNSIGLCDYIKTIAYCEQDRHAQSVLLSRMADGSLERAPIWEDITTLRGEHFDVPINIIVGGFPCQDASEAGRAKGSGKGLDGERTGLFFEVVRLIGELRPEFVFLENVSGLVKRGLDRAVLAFDSLGYDVRWSIVSAGSVGAPHSRERLFILAHAKGYRDQGVDQELGGEKFQGQGEVVCPVAARQASHPGSLGTNLQRTGAGSGNRDAGSQGHWLVEPGVPRMDDGIPHQLDRIKRLGNAVVPAQAREAFEILMGLK